MSIRNKKFNRSGFTLAEILIVVGIISIFSAVVVVTMRDDGNVTSRVKLQQDVATLNNAVRVYLVGGGSLDGLTAPGEVLAKLKTRAANASQIASASGSMIDRRLMPELGLGSESEVAIWNPTSQLFEVVDPTEVPESVTPVRKFVLSDEEGLKDTVEQRKGSFDLATKNHWVWDYETSVVSSPPRVVNRTDGSSFIPSGRPQFLTNPLLAPVFSLPQGTYPLSTFPAAVSISNPNPSDISVLWSNLTSNPWEIGQTSLVVMPGDTARAYAEPINPDKFTNSPTTVVNYSAIKLTLEAGDNLRNSFRYGDLGGPLAQGSVIPQASLPGKLLLMNANDLPDYWENHNTFQMFWTLDGSNPDTNGGSRGSGDNTFVINYPGDEVPLGLATFGSSPSVPLKYYAAAKNAAVVNSSTIGQKILTRAITPLLPPLITPGTGSLSGTDPVAMTLDLTGGQTPAGARIYYRSDGSDPGSGPDPGPGAVLYNGTFMPAPSSDPVVAIVARVYPPTAYKDWFITSPAVTRTYFLPYVDKNVYGVIGTDNDIYVADPDLGSTMLINGAAPFNMRTLALDSNNALLYYTETAASGWRLGRYDIINQTHAILGSLATGRTYNATRQIENLSFLNDKLYYIHDNTDDLIQITLSGDAIASASKVADVQANAATFSRVGDLAIDDTGWAYFNDSNKRYYRYNLLSFTGFKRIGDTERDNDALALYQGRLYGGEGGSDDIRRISAGNGTTLSKIKTVPARRFQDFGSPTASISVGGGSSIWMISDAADGPHLHEIRNYRNPVLAADVDYGILYYLDGTSKKDLEDGDKGYIQSMCISSAGMLYFTRNFQIRVAGKDYKRPVLKLNLGSLVLGDSLNSTFVGDLTPGLTAIAGTIDPDDIVTGITLSPGGQLYGVLREGATTGATGADFLFRVTQSAASMAGPTLPVSLIGKMSSSLGVSTQTEDLTFAPDGTLYASDVSDNHIYRVDSGNGSIVSVFSIETDTDYRGLAVDPLDYRLIGTSDGTGSPPNNIVKIDGGNGNDDAIMSLQTKFGLRDVEAIAFFQGTFVLTNDTPDLYAADGTETIYGVDFDTGSTAPITDAPFRVRALAYDFKNRRLFYVRNSLLTLSLGSYKVDTNVHTTLANLWDGSFAYTPGEAPDNLCFFGGHLWYVPPHTDDLIKIQLNTAGGVVSQTKAVDMTNDTFQFDLIGDLAVAPDGWMYFTAVNFEGQRFCRFRLPMLGNFEVVSGPTAPSISGGAENFTEKWFDALAFRPPDATGNRGLYASFSSAPSPLRTVSTTDGSSTHYKPTIPPVQMIDFSDYHPGAMGSSTSVVTPMLAFTNLAAGYTYADVGGTFVPGSVAAPTPVSPPRIVLANANQIPLSQQDSNFFTVKWTYDGQDPGTSASAITGPNFSAGMPSMPVAIDFAKWGNRTSLPLTAIAKSKQVLLINDSEPLTTSVPILKTELRDPQIIVVTDASGTRTVQITGATDAGDCPPGVRIYYTTDGSDPGVTTNASGVEVAVAGTLYSGPIAVPSSGGEDFVVTARVYPPIGLGAWFTTSLSDYLGVPLGIAGGHMDVDTAHLIYPFRKGSTDGHVHEYDKKFNVVGESFFAFKTTTLKNIPVYVANGVKFKIIVANANLSSGGRLSINKIYNSADASTYTPVKNYDDQALSSLPIYSLDGVAGTTRLTSLGLYFDTNVIAAGGLVPTVTGAVRSNTPGKLGEWRNGALTIQLVRVNADGTDGFKTNTNYSNGGVQGVATSGLLWETTFFWHHNGPPYGS